MSGMRRRRALASAFAFLASVWCLLLSGAPAQAAGYLHASGTRLLDGNNQPILLRGVNLGTWLYPELWMMGAPNLSLYAGTDDFEKLNAAMKDVLGGDTNLLAHALDTMRSDFITADDIVFLHNQGFNCVRVPFHYELFYDPVNGVDIDTGFAYFDNLLTWCSTNGIYVIPDFHGVPGGKFYSAAGNVYTNAANHALFLHVWTRIASRYATNAWLGGYDLINEPVVNSGTFLSSTYGDAKTAIRSVDTNHVLVCEGDNYAVTLSRINNTHWIDSNVLYSDHRYGNPLPIATDRKALCVGTNVPLWTGEFGYNSTHWNNRIISEFEQPDTLTSGGRTATIQASWCYWSYKTPQMYVLAEHQQPSGWTTLKNYWAATNTVSKPSVTNAYTWIAQFAQATIFTNCQVHKEVLDGLTRSNASFSTQRLPYNIGVTIPGKITAAYYDLGAEGLAYHDTVYDDEAGQGPAGVTWNSGWYGRDDGVDITSCSDPGTPLKVGWNDAGEWQRHTVSCTPGNYTLQIRYGGGAAGGQVHVLVNGVNVSATLTLPTTGGYATYSTYTLNNVAVTASGNATVEIGCDHAGYDLVWIQFLTAAPAKPAAPAAVASAVDVNLSWPVALGATTYAVKRSLASGGPFANLATGLLATNYTDAAVTNGVTYYYVVSASNAIGQSPNSDSASATLPLPKLALVLSATDLTLSWPASATQFKLYSTADLAPPIAWSLVTNALQNSDGIITVTLPTSDGNQFFRMSAP